MRLDDDGDALVTRVLGEFPHVCGAFAYGSAIFEQRGYTTAHRRDAMIDLIFVVDDAARWHADNMAGGNAAHYSGIAYFGGRAVAEVQHAGGGMYYNHANVHGRRLKYGVITRHALNDDLQAWSSLYASGRLHKPVRVLTPWPEDIAPHVASNLRAAVYASLLLLPSRFDGDTLLSAICNLSYEGDVRMGIGESNRKPGNIAAGQRAALGHLYAPSLRALEAEGYTVSDANAPAPTGTQGSMWDGSSLIEQDASLDARRRLLAALPSNAQRALLLELRPSLISTEGTGACLDEAARTLWRGAKSEHEANRQLSAALRTSLRRIVYRSSLAQTAKGIATAGVATSIAYAVGKIRKRLGQDRQGGA